jgi:hypothetical protein
MITPKAVSQLTYTAPPARKSNKQERPAFPRKQAGTMGIATNCDESSVAEMQVSGGLGAGCISISDFGGTRNVRPVSYLRCRLPGKSYTNIMLI